MILNNVYGTGTTTSESKVTKSTYGDSTKKSSDTSSTVSTSEEEASAVYEKSSDTETKKKVYTKDTATINQLKEEAEKRTSQLRDLVEKMLLKQGQSFDESNMYALLREGKVEVDPETAAQATEDISEDGYWGVEQTSDRLVSFAKALSGGDPAKADEMMEAIQKGFEEATKTWGDELPEICQNTLDATMKKIEEWKNSTATE